MTTIETPHRTPDGSASGSRPTFSPGYLRYAVVLLSLTYALSMLDRQVVNILAERIKADLHLADWQLGLLTGMAFALLYTVLGLPIARLADRGHRPFVIAASVTIWSTFTALCGLTHNFVQLLLARAGVGVGEAGGTPPALSLISDYAPKEKRASYVGIYMAGASLGSLLGLAVGGVVADAFGWRATFVIIGLPGLAIGALVALSLREPRSAADRRQARAVQVPGRLMADLKLLWRKPAYRWVVVAATARAFETYSAQTFYGSFYLRNHLDALQQAATPLGLKPLGLLGLALGLAFGVSGMVGVVVGGYVTDRAARKDIRAFATLPAGMALLAAPFAVSAFLVDSLLASLSLLAVGHVMMVMCTAPSFTSVQGLAPPESRATATAVMLFVVSLVGLGLGPVSAGLLSDVLGSVVGLGSAEGVRWALVCVALVGLIASGASWAARKTLARDMVS